MPPFFFECPCLRCQLDAGKHIGRLTIPSHPLGHLRGFPYPTSHKRSVGSPKAWPECKSIEAQEQSYWIRPIPPSIPFPLWPPRYSLETLRRGSKGRELSLFVVSRNWYSFRSTHCLRMLPASHAVFHFKTRQPPSLQTKRLLSCTAGTSDGCQSASRSQDHGDG